jgi:hypothetical protein
MRKLFFILVFIFSAVAGMNAQHLKNAAVADSEFFYLYGGTSSDIGRSIKETHDGGYIIAGTSSSFGPGAASVYLIKTDSMGKHLWSNTYGGHQNDWGYTLELTYDSGYFVAGYSNSFNPSNGYDVYYFKTDRNGNLLWEKTVSGTEWDFIYGSVAMPDSGFVLCGETYTQSNGGTDAYLIRLNKDGDPLWTKHYGDSLDETFNAVTVMNNRIYAVGKNQTHSAAKDTAADAWIVKLDFNGVILKDTSINNATYNHFEEILLGITPYPTGDFFHFCGRENQLDNNATSSLFGRLDTALVGGWMFSKGPKSPGYVEIFNHVINLDTGNVCAIGNAFGGLGGQNMYIVGFGPGDNFINGFIRHSGGTQNDYGYDGIFTSKKKIVGIGSSESFCAGLEDVFLVRFDGDTIQNGILTALSPKIVCFTDTLSLWVVSTKTFNSDYKINLFPNPAGNATQLQINCSGQKTFTAKVYSVLGTEVFSSKVESNISNQLDISTLPEGSYFIKVLDEKEQTLSVLKLVVSK